MSPPWDFIFDFNYFATDMSPRWGSKCVSPYEKCGARTSTKPGPALTFGAFMGALFFGKALKRESGANPEQFPLL